MNEHDEYENVAGSHRLGIVPLTEQKPTWWGLTWVGIGLCYMIVVGIIAWVVR